MQHNMPCDAFAFSGAVRSCERYGSGHINETCRVLTDGGDYILQKVSRTAFHDPAVLMENVVAVIRHLRQKTDDPRGALSLVPTRDGRDYLLTEAGECWRAYDFIEGSICLDAAQTPEDFYQSAVAFGTFQRQLADFPAASLHETIPDFHNTPARIAQFRAALEADACGRAASARAEIDFVLRHAAEADALTGRLAAGELPLRVTHNDTKLNNVMLDAATRRALCVIDLDTVMPGLSLYDYGDSIRFGASTAAEDEPDVGRVDLDLRLFETYTRGYLASCGSALTEAEIALFPMGAKMMTFECGTRFLTDYLSGDTYFHTARAGHNLDRCRTQFRLVARMEDRWQQMEASVRRIAEEVLR